jgi:hypothetical protein
MGIKSPRQAYFGVDAKLLALGKDTLDATVELLEADYSYPT